MIENLFIRFAVVAVLLAPATAADIETVHFPSEEGKTRLVGYLFPPVGSGRHPAVVMLHGRAGPYSSLAHGVYDATTLSRRHKEWGQFWSERGYVALLVDSFGPRGYPEGFPKGSYDKRPPAVSEQTVRPLDAYGALRYLRLRNDIDPHRIGVQGWSNGGMTVLITMGHNAPGIENPTPETGFRAALALYPGCGMPEVRHGYVPYAPLHLFIAAEDEEVSPKLCEQMAERIKAEGGPVTAIVYPGAHHDFDDPSKTKQSYEPNYAATVDALSRAESFFREHLLEHSARLRRKWRQ